MARVLKRTWGSTPIRSACSDQPLKSPIAMVSPTISGELGVAYPRFAGRAECATCPAEPRRPVVLLSDKACRFADVVSFCIPRMESNTPQDVFVMVDFSLSFSGRIRILHDTGLQ